MKELFWLHSTHQQRMPRKSIDLPPEIAHRFVRDMHAFLAERDTIKADASPRINCTH
jgi:hypothetical protein